MSKKEIKVVNGNGNDLNISPVYNHIKSNSSEKSDTNKKKNIVIPKKKSDKQ